jgi:protoheme IX farnesyltransferase
MTHKTDLITIRRYLSLTKPGVLFGNVITGVAGFLLASAYLRAFDLLLFVATIVGMTLIIASACAFNNVFDRDIDSVMVRTKQRAVASGSIRPLPALTFATILGVLGVAIVAVWTNWLVVAIGVGGFVVYVWLYGVLAKRRSIHGTLVGSISGAAPILAGYVAARGRIDAAAVLVFLALFFWQFPEFYSIAIYRKKEYAAANVPVATVVKGVAYAKRWIAIYAALFVLAALLLTSFGYTGYIYFICMAAISAYWLALAMRGFRAAGTTASDTWARRMFHASLNILLLYSLLIAIGPLLP